MYKCIFVPSVLQWKNWAEKTDYSASLVFNADSVHHMFIYTKREKEGQCVIVDLLGNLLFGVLT